MGERRRDQTPDVHLPHALRPLPGVQGMVLNKAEGSPSAAWCARSITAAIWGSATAHNADTDLTGEKVRSYPATGWAGRRDSFAIAADNSRSSVGTRPCWA
jgi:hypothetical protein